MPAAINVHNKAMGPVSRRRRHVGATPVAVRLLAQGQALRLPTNVGVRRRRHTCVVGAGP